MACSCPITLQISQIPPGKQKKERWNRKATCIVRRVEDPGRIVIPKEIRRTLRIRGGDLLQIAWQPWERFCNSMRNSAKMQGW